MKVVTIFGFIFQVQNQGQGLKCILVTLQSLDFHYENIVLYRNKV